MSECPATPPEEDATPHAAPGSPKRTPLPANIVAGVRKKRRQRALPLSVDVVTGALESLTDQWEEVGKDVLQIPHTVVASFSTKFSNDAERLKAAVHYWLLKDPLASWRKLIYRLDDVDRVKGSRAVAAKIYGNAEKQLDPTLTCRNLSAVLKGLRVDDVKFVLNLPFPKREELREQHWDDSQYKAALVKHYVKTHPYASWVHIAGMCLRFDIKSALQATKRWMKFEKDSTLTLTSLVGLLKDVNLWHALRWSIDIPNSVNSKLKSSDQETMARNYCDWYLKNHPAPSWEHVAIALYDNREHDILARLRDQVPSLKGSKGSRDMFSKYMKLGYVESCIGKMLVYGACGTGKSSFMDLMVGNSPRLVRKSTPLAARPVAVFQLDASGEKKWTKLNKAERKKILIKALMSVQPQEDQEEDTSSEEKDLQGETCTSDIQQSEQHHYPVIIEDQKTHPTPTTQDTRHTEAEATPTPTTPEEKEILKVSTCDDLVHLVQQCTASGEATTSYRKILLIDSGGQPQFHVLLPVFLRRMSLYVFVFKLSDELDGRPAVEYYDESGKLIGKPYESAQTNKQLLQHCLRTLHTHRSSSKGKASKILVVGTHRDMEAQCTAEKREDKEKKLLKILLPDFKEEVVYSKARPKRFIFALNTKNPESEDRALIEKIQKLVAIECSPEPVKVPLHYFALELVLEEASEKLGRGVLSIEECLEAAAELHFDRHTLDLALQYLDELSVVFYFPEVLEGVLFINTQVLLDKATELVQKQYQLQEDGSLNLIVGEWLTFLENGRFNEKFLSNFSQHYLPGLFTPVELVKLFKKLLIFADFHGDQLFMPALLRVLKEEEVSEYCAPADSPAAPLAVDFPLGGPRLGVFCALSCFLVSSNNQFPSPWKIKLDPDYETPVCLYRNCIRFSVPDYSGSVTLIDFFSHFQVHVRSSECCSIVCEAILFGLKKVHATLGYLDCTPSLAFVCPCKKGIPHMATVKRTKWICKRDSDESGIAGARYQVWECKKDDTETISLPSQPATSPPSQLTTSPPLQPTTSPPSQPTASPPLTMSDHYKVLKQLRDLGNQDLYMLGGALGLHYPSMKRMHDLMADMVAAWLNAEDNVLMTSGYPCWASLIKALEEIGLHGVANKITAGMHIASQPTSSSPSQPTTVA